MRQTMMARVRAYLTHRRALGFKLVSEGCLLLDFARFADRRYSRAPLTLKLALRWVSQTRSADRLYHARRLEVLRPFARHLSILDRKTEVPPRHLLGPAHRRPEPFIFSRSQILELMRRAEQLSGSLRPHTFKTLIGLLTCTGLRISEALHLKIDDVDLEQGILIIRESKNRKTRCVPLHASAMEPLQAYARHRDKRFPGQDAFFVSERGTAIAYSTVRQTFGKLRSGIAQHRRSVRFQDLRHTFTCEVLTRWQASIEGAAHRIPILSRYLGHAHVTDTYWYLTGLPGLMSAAAKRFAAFHDEDA